MASPTSNLTNFFVELSKCEQTGDFEKGHRLCNKILNVDSSNRKAKLCKIICKIHLGQYEDALKEINKTQNEEIRDELLFEKAYCEYSLNKVDECLATLDQLDDADTRKKELRAQAFYKKELYSDCYGVYIDLIKNVQDDFEEERATNLTAALAALKLTRRPEDSQPENEPTLLENTFEQCYNNACVELGNCNYENAIKKLNKAGNICKQTMENDEATEEEIASELNMIHAQIAYAYQKMGNNKQALDIYNQIIKQKPTDTSLLAIVNNNIVSINQDQNIFDSKKKMKIAVTDLDQTKLAKFQRRVILMNNLLLLLNTNQNKLANEELIEFKRQFEDDCRIDLLLVNVALLFNEKQTVNSIKQLEDAIKSKKYSLDEKLQLVLSLAQIHLDQKDLKTSIKVLKSLEQLTYTLAIISAVVSLELCLKNHQNAIAFLKESIDWLKKNSDDKNSLYVLYKETSNIMIQNNESKNAITMLEELRKANPSDPKLIINLINAYSQVNMSKAKELAKELPQIEQLVSQVDVVSLESSSWSAGAKYVKKTLVAGDSLNKKEEKVKRKRKRKIKLPKNYDPNVKPDPERWLPKWQRKTYKKRKNDRRYNVSKGTQGSTAVSADQTVSSTAQSPRPLGTSPASNLTRQQRMQKKKKKGGKR